ncbi:MAG TPA: M23 family metallopeptidase [Candidatus Aminicenantes bacterium]|nr:M23 family metallopeptidase [Candidatus Aminicenantes bacterium]
MTLPGAKKSRKYSVIIVSDATATNREFTVSSKLIRNALLGGSFLVVFFGVILFSYLTMTLDEQKMRRLEADARAKKRQISEMTATIGVLNERLRQMEIYKEKIMVATGLTSPLALREVGSGGPDASAAGADFSVAVPLLPGTPPKSALPPVADVRAKARHIEESLKTVEKYVNQQKLQLAATPAIWPTRGILSGHFGNRIHPFTGRYEFHNAVDIATQLGNKVIAPADGVVLVAETRDYYGKMVIIDHGFGYVTRYGHLSGYNVREGQRVKRFDVIGYVGTTGRSNGPHLHYEVRYYDKPMNPFDFILDN